MACFRAVIWLVSRSLYGLFMDFYVGCLWAYHMLHLAFRIKGVYCLVM